MTTLELCAAFRRRLREVHHLELEEIMDGIYVGESSDVGGPVSKSSIDYEAQYPDMIRPPYVCQCLCGHEIVINCHVYCPGADLTLAVGSDCVKHFFEAGKRRICVTCRKPNKAHTAQCVDCRPPPTCRGCGGFTSRNQDTCRSCEHLPPCVRCQMRRPLWRTGQYAGSCYQCCPRPTGGCDSCARPCNAQYTTCYSCKFSGRCVTLRQAVPG